MWRPIFSCFDTYSKSAWSGQEAFSYFGGKQLCSSSHSNPEISHWKLRFKARKASSFIQSHHLQVSYRWNTVARDWITLADIRSTWRSLVFFLLLVVLFYWVIFSMSFSLIPVCFRCSSSLLSIGLKRVYFDCSLRHVGFCFFALS